MWNGVFHAVPDFKGNPHVVFVISPFEKRPRFGEREFFTNASYNAEISRALAIFYANDSLEGEFMYKNAEINDTPTFCKDGIMNPPTYSGVIPFSQIVFIDYDRSTKKVHIVKDLKKEFGIDNSNYDAEKFINPKPMTRDSLRYILSDCKSKGF
jgi:hypothetical protein